MITFPGDLSIATAVDESCVMPAAVTLVSLCQLWDTRLNGALAAAAPGAYARMWHASRVAAVDVPAMPLDAPRIDSCAWNGLVRTRDREMLGGAVRAVARHPWTVVTYAVHALRPGVTSWHRRQGWRHDDRSAAPTAGPERPVV